jgi:hypothetical protein
LDVERSVEWLFEHMDDADIDSPLTREQIIQIARLNSLRTLKCGGEKREGRGSRRERREKRGGRGEERRGNEGRGREERREREGERRERAISYLNYSARTKFSCTHPSSTNSPNTTTTFTTFTTFTFTTRSATSAR